MADSALNSTATRLRKAFKYPSDDPLDGPNEGIDEQEQEQLIADLRAKDAVSTMWFQRLFAATITFPAVFFLPGVIGPQHFGLWLRSILSVASIAFTSSILWLVPIEFDIKAGARRLFSNDRAGDRAELLAPGIVALNAILSTLLALPSLLFLHSTDVTLNVLPLGMFLASLALRHILRPVDLSPLQEARYRYKGA